MNVNWTTIVQLVTTIVTGIIFFWLSDWKKKMEESSKQNACDIKDVANQLNEFKNQMPYNYTLREDHIRAMANLEKKVEKMNDSIEQKLNDINTKIEQKLDSYFQNFDKKIDKMEEHFNSHILKKEG